MKARKKVKKAGAKKTVRKTVKKAVRKTVKKAGAKKTVRKTAKRKKTTTLNKTLGNIGIKKYVKLKNRNGVIISKGTKKLTTRQRARLTDYHLSKASGKGIAVLRNPMSEHMFMGQPYNPYEVVAQRASKARSGGPKVTKVKAKRKQTAAQRLKRKKKLQSISNSVKIGLAPRQTVSKKRKKPMATVRKGGLFKITSRKGSVIMKRKNPGLAGSFVDVGAPTVGFGSMFDTGHTKNELLTVAVVGLAAPFISALAARIPAVQKIQAMPDYGVPAVFIAIGGVVAAKMQSPMYKNAGKALVTVGLITLASNLAKKLTASKGGVKGMMDGMLGSDGYEGYDGDDVGEYGDMGDMGADEIDLSGDDSQMAALPAGLRGVDFTPSHKLRAFGEVPQGYAGSQMAGVDFTPSQQLRSFGDMGRDGADFGSPRDGADFGDSGMA